MCHVLRALGQARASDRWTVIYDPARHGGVSAGRPSEPDDSEDPFRYGWRERWETADDGTKKLRYLPLTYEDLLNPQVGDRVSEDSIHRILTEKRRPFDADAQGRLYSETSGLLFGTGADGRGLEIRDAETQELLHPPAEEAVLQAQRAEEERVARLKAEAKAEEQRAEAEKLKAEKQEALAKIERLEARLRQLEGK